MTERADVRRIRKTSKQNQAKESCPRCRRSGWLFPFMPSLPEGIVQRQCVYYPGAYHHIDLVASCDKVNSK